MISNADSEPATIALIEHLALRSTLPLEDFCARFQSELHLPAFHFDAENATEWGFSELHFVEYNISKPYKANTLREWDSTVPSGCNFGIALMLLHGHAEPSHEWAYEHWDIPVARAVAKEFSTVVHYHRTWFGPGKNVARTDRFRSDDV